MSGNKDVFGTALTDVTSTDVEGLGQLRVESDPVLGDRVFRWVANRSGGTLAADSIAGYESVSTGSAFTAGTNTDKSLIVGTFTAGLFNGMYARVLDDAGAAGAAPEGEIQK